MVRENGFYGGVEGINPDAVGMQRIETGELSHGPRLEKIVFCLQRRMREIIQDTERAQCEFRFTVNINHYTHMVLATVLNHADADASGEFLITGLIYTVLVTETDYALAEYETTTEGKDPSLIVKEIERQLDRFDLKHLYYCRHCMDQIVERGKACCDGCELSKITYEEMCAICHDDDYRTLSSVWGKLECGHVFHKHCVMQIVPFSQVTEQIKCPLCRHEQEKGCFVI